MNTKTLLAGHISRGNTKLPGTTWIFNLGSSLVCPSEVLGLCQVINSGIRCYAQKAEKTYGGAKCTAYRERQTEIWATISPEDFALTVIDMNKRARMNKCKFFRFNESGDFWGQDCVDKMERIAHLLHEGGGIYTYTYTARSDLNFDGCNHLTVNGSGFKVHNSYTVIDAETFALSLQQGAGRESNTFFCVANCDFCSACVHDRGLRIYAKQH